ncbi:MAG: nuclear transport factor 2 family protein [Bdellovibrionales bacterium]|nr:nuclear transport factor 2 family protein [Bdellovibrionales bacterium]
MEQQLVGLDPEKANMVRANLENMVKTVEQKQLEMQQKMAQAEYSIGEVSVQGNAATVELVSSLDGETKTRSLPLEKIEGRWYLPGMSFISEKR